MSMDENGWRWSIWAWAKLTALKKSDTSLCATSNHPQKSLGPSTETACANMCNMCKCIQVLPCGGRHYQVLNQMLGFEAGWIIETERYPFPKRSIPSWKPWLCICRTAPSCLVLDLFILGSFLGGMGLPAQPQLNHYPVKPLTYESVPPHSSHQSPGMNWAFWKNCSSEWKSQPHNPNNIGFVNEPNMVHNVGGINIIKHKSQLWSENQGIPWLLTHSNSRLR